MTCCGAAGVLLGVGSAVFTKVIGVLLYTVYTLHNSLFGRGNLRIELADTS